MRQVGMFSSRSARTGAPPYGGWWSKIASGSCVSKHTTNIVHFVLWARWIALFQEQDGLDVLLFVVVAHEYDRGCPPPNKGHVVISYLDLDTVNFLRPAG